MLPPGCHVREHGHLQNHEPIFIAEGEGYWVFMPPGLEDWFAAIGRPRSAGESMPESFQRPDDVAEVMARMRFVPPRANQDN